MSTNKHVKYDVVVIGSGVAGALAAHKLSASGLTVCILEAGDHWERQTALKKYQSSTSRIITSPFKQFTWLNSPANQDYYAGKSQLKPTFLKGVGGTTWMWSGVTPRFLPNDFKLKSNYGIGVDWPISYSDLEKFYVEAEQALAVSGDSNDDHGSPRSKPYAMKPIPLSYSDHVIAQKLRSKGLKVAPFPLAKNSREYDGRPACQGNNTCTPLCPTGASYSADETVKKAINAGATLITKAVVFQLEVDTKQKVSAAHYMKPDGSRHFIKAKQFIIACNAIETPRLLLMSKSNKLPNGIANSSGKVGCNLMDHSKFISQFSMPEPLYIGRGPQSISTILHGRDGKFRSKHAAAKLFINNDLNIQREAVKILKNSDNWLSPLKRIEKVIAHQGKIGFEVEQLPVESNRLTINKDRKDPLGLPLPEISYQLHPYTKKGIEVWKSYVFMLVKHLNATIEDEDFTLSSHHPSGTTSMGNHAKNSIVDKNCQTHDHKNLYIAGSSVFTTQGTANPTLTIAALSLRLSSYIIQQHNSIIPHDIQT